MYLCAGILMAACGSGTTGYSIKGSITGDVADGTKVYLKKVDENNQAIDLDTATVTKGNFSFEGTPGPLEMHFLAFDNLRGFVPVILEKGSIELSMQKDSLNMAKVSGTPQNDMFADYLEGAREVQEKINTMNRDMQQASMAQDTATMNSLRDEFMEIRDNAVKYEIDFIKEHPEALISAMLIDKGTSTHAIEDKEGMDMFNALSEEVKNSPFAQKLKERLEKNLATAIGAKAPDFSAPTPEGGELALSDVKGKVVLIDFWAGWCRPCRAENPNLVKLYNEYHDKGFEILGVSLDRKAEEWKQAIADDGLVWKQISNVQYFDKIAELYNVQAIPANFILDENGVILAKNLRGEELQNKIAELLP